MKIEQLYEADVPQWVKKLDDDYKHLLHACGFEDSTPPKPENAKNVKGKQLPTDSLTPWRFGKYIRPLPDNDIFSKDELMDMGKTALPGEIAKFLIKLAKDNPSRLVRIVQSYQFYGFTREADYRIVHPDDNVKMVTDLVATALRDHRKDDKRRLSQSDMMVNDLSFTWEIDPPKELKPEEPQRKLLRVVKKAAA